MTQALALPAGDGSCCIQEHLLSLPGDFRLANGETLKDITVAARMCGPADAPIIIALGGISAHRAPVTAPFEEQQGWWQGVLGARGANVLARFRVLSIDWLGGSGQTTGPSSLTDQAFPSIDTSDQASLLARVLDDLEIDSVESIVSASYGGMVALHFARQYPERLGRLLVIGCAHRPEPMAVARRFVQKQILELAHDEESAGKAVAVARALAMTTYRSAAEFRSRFGGPEGRRSLESYLQYQGQKFAQRFDRESALTLMDSIDGHTVNPADIRTPLWLLGIDTDELCPPPLIRELAAMAPGTQKLSEIHSLYGHDAFLCEAGQVGAFIHQFLKGATS